MTTMDIIANPWEKKRKPKRILVIRLQALGDIIATLPYIQHIRSSFPPETRIDFLTREEYALLPKQIELFNQVFIVKGGRKPKQQLLHLFLLLPKLLLNRYEVVLDLQNNRISKIARYFSFPKAWSELDKFSPNMALKRFQNTISAVKITDSVKIQYGFKLKKQHNTFQLLTNQGFSDGEMLVLLNPAAAFPTRNWPVESYIEFIELWNIFHPNTKYLLLGLSKIAEKARIIKSKFPDQVINLVEKTSLSQLVEIISIVNLAISEDGGLMHLSYLSKIPTVGLLGSTRNDWTNPMLEHTRFFNSSDLECGNCMLAVCPRGDNYCMIRIEAEQVFEKATELYKLYCKQEM